MKRLLVMSLLLVTLSIFSVSNVFACSGGGWATWNEALSYFVESSDTIVVGQFVELDDMQLNGIFRVDSYLMGGEGVEHITIQMNDVRQIESQYNALRYFNCGINRVGGRLSLTGQYVLYLERDIDGSYHKSSYFYQTFATPDSTITVHNDAEIDVQTLQSQLLNIIGQSASAPDNDTFYPRTTPVILTTVSGRQYLLPVDGTAPVRITQQHALERRRDQHECSPAPCTAYSPNGLDVVYLLREADERQRVNDYAITQEHYVYGSRVSFSATSEVFVVWHDGALQLYSLWYPELGFPEDLACLCMYFSELIYSIPVDDSSLNYPAIWSPDGRTLAFSDDSGLWLWDVFTTDYPPQLLIPTTGNAIPIARYYSPQGRYLAVTVGEERYNLDLVTRRELPDGYIAPNDRTMLIFDTAAEGETTLDIAYLVPTIRRFTYYSGVNYYQVEWIDNTQFYATVGGQGYLEYEAVWYEDGTGEAIPYLVEESFRDVQRYNIRYLDGSQRVPYGVDYHHPVSFDYQAGSGLIELGQDGYTLLVQNRIVDLSHYFDEPIMKAEWLPSIFYYED